MPFLYENSKRVLQQHSMEENKGCIQSIKARLMREVFSQRLNKSMRGSTSQSKINC